MQPIWFLTNPRDPQLKESVAVLIKDSLERLIYATTAILFVWFFIIGQSSVDLLIWRFWVVMGFSILVVRGSISLLQRHVVIANIVWLVGLFLITSAFIFLLNRPEAVFFYPIIALQAAATLGWSAGLTVVVVVAAMMGYISGTTYIAYLRPFITATVAGCAMSAFLGWVAASTLLAEVQNSTFFSRLASMNLDEAREHRGQLVKIFKDLDLAYYRLERANASLVAAWNEAENAERSKAELITYVSHEMRTPLNLLIGFSETILTSPESYGGSPLPGPYREDLNKINQNARHLMALVDDVIDLSRANVNRIHLARETVSVSDILGETTDMVRDYIHSKKLELTVTIDPELKIIQADRLRIRQVMLNLLVNAARFTESGGIHIKAFIHNQAARFEVRDTGKGITEKDREKIFEEFYSDSPQSKTWHSGSGLGLPISKKLIELHGGRMGVDSILNQGTTFWFTLPLELTSHQEKPVMRPFTITPYHPRTLDRTVVLVHSDHRMVNSLQRVMEGVRVIPATNLDEGLALAEENQAVAVMAPSFPPGVEIPAAIHCIECTIPGLSDIARQMGVLDILEKPVSPVQLVDRLNELRPRPRKILIIDDDPDIVQLFQRVLYTSFSPENCLGAYNGQEGLDMIRQEKPDLVLLDLIMEGVSGYDIIEAVNTDPELKEIRVIVVSGTVPKTTSENICEGFRVTRAGGLSLPVLGKSLEAMLKELAPGWQ